jgi:hypothetical protein
MRRLRGDRRGVTVQIGAILLFGIVILSLATYQAIVVPIENERVEFNHNQAVQQDMLELRSAVLGTGTGAGFRSVPVELGTTYPPRVLLVNPPVTAGRLATGPPRTASLENLAATDNETDDFLNTTATGPYTLSTRGVSYSPSYNEYDSAPTTTLQLGTAVNENPRGNETVLSDQTVVQGAELTLVTVAGNLSAARSGTVAVDPESLSASTRATTVRNTSAGNLTVTVPTALPADRWRALLGDEYDPGFDGPGHVYRVGDVPGRPAVELALDSGVTYRLRTALVGVGTATSAPGPAYVTAVDGDDDVTVEVRDRYNNAVPNSRIDDTLYVNATENRSLIADPRVKISEDGQAAFAFNSTATSDDAPATLKFTLENGSGAGVVSGTPGNVTVVVEESDLPANTSGADSDSAPQIDAYDLDRSFSRGTSEITATVDVSDADDNLDTVTFERIKDGSVQETKTAAVSGGSATGVERSFTYNGNSESEVRVTVTDTAGSSGSQTKSD